MTSEPLTVEELERWLESKGYPRRSYEAGHWRFGYDAVLMLLQENAKSHSRQLWLEAAEQLDDYKRAIIRTGAVPNDRSVQSALDFMANRFRAKAESTPKPSPALPAQETK